MAIDEETFGYWLCNNDDDNDNDNLDITYTQSNACSVINGFLTGLQELNLRLCRIIRLLRESGHKVGVLFVISNSILNYRGPGSSVGIATNYGLDGPGSNSGGDDIFRPSRPALGSTQPPVKWVKCGRGVLLTTHPLLVPRSWKSRAIPLPTL